jgi:hypothetical protein
VFEGSGVTLAATNFFRIDGDAGSGNSVIPLSASGYIDSGGGTYATIGHYTGGIAFASIAPALDRYEMRFVVGTPFQVAVQTYKVEVEYKYGQLQSGA